MPDPFHKMNEEVFTAVPDADIGLSSQQQNLLPGLAYLTKFGSPVHPIFSHESQLSATKVGIQDGMHQGGDDISWSITPGGNPIDTSQPGFPVFHRKFGTPAPVGLIPWVSGTHIAQHNDC